MAENAAAAPEKMAFPARMEGRQWVPDERDGFISWLRGEFAAANAIIDSLCHHLRTTGDPGEYDMLIESIQHRRCNWNPILHMQQYFSVAEVVMALQQVAWQRQHRGFDHPKPAGKDFRRQSFGYRHGGMRENCNSTTGWNAGPDRPRAGIPAGVSVDRRGRANCVEKEGGENLSSSKAARSPKDSEKDHEAEKSNTDPITDEGESSISSKETENTIALLEVSATIPKQEQAQESVPVPKSFVCDEICDGKLVNVFEGLKLYEDFLDSSEVLKFVSLANSLRVAGKKGDFQGRTFIATRKPSKGHGKETIQLGTCLYDGFMEDENTAGTFREKKVEAIPALLQDVFDRLTQQQIIVTKPDYCVIDFFSEGEHSQPHMWLLRYGRPLFHLVLTDCDMVFGRTINLEGRGGDFRGPLRLSLKEGSLLMLQGRCADVVKRAIPSVSKQRIIITFGKSQLKETPPSNGLRQNLSILPSAQPWSQNSTRSTNFARRPSGQKSYGMVSGSGVLQAPHIRPQQPSAPNGIQPLFVSQTPVPINAVPYNPVQSVPTSSGWPVIPPRKADTARLTPPGTGVFLPPTGTGPSHPATLENSSPTNSSPSEKMHYAPHDAEHTGKPSSSAEKSPGDISEESSTSQPLNTRTNSCDRVNAEKEEDSSHEAKKQANNKHAYPDAIAAKH